VTGEKRGRLFWISAGVGWAAIAWGVIGIFSNLARFVVGGALLHDLLVAPLAIIACVLLTRAVPGPARAPVQAALAITAVVALFAYPLVRGYGLAANNPTSLPHNYGLNLLVVLGMVWAGAAAAIVVRLKRNA
jgi:hypothetical protein